MKWTQVNTLPVSQAIVSFRQQTVEQFSETRVIRKCRLLEVGVDINVMRFRYAKLSSAFGSTLFKKFSETRVYVVEECQLLEVDVETKPIRFQCVRLSSASGDKLSNKFSETRVVKRVQALRSER